MTDDTWPDLSGWYPLPEGGTFPKGLRYAVLYATGGLYVSTADDDFTPPDSACDRFHTERPVPVPLPTDEGARIIAYGPWLGLAELTLTTAGWRTKGGSLRDDITRWMPATEWRER